MIPEGYRGVARVPQSEDFTGPGALFALLLAWVVWDYTYAPRDTPAYETARMFIEGERCEHDGVVYDWGEHRDHVIGLLGLDRDAFLEQVRRRT